MKYIFISYSRQNLSFAERLAHDLHDAGLDVWLDVRQIKGGEQWREAIFAGISQSEIVVVCLSPSAIDSEWVRREILMARSQGKVLIPAMVEDCFEGMQQYEETRFLLDLQVLDFQNSYEQAFPRLLEALPGVQIGTPEAYVEVDPAATPTRLRDSKLFRKRMPRSSLG